jgi:hypothetical protein
MARIHIEIDDDLHREVKATAALQGTTLKAFVIQSLQAAVARPPTPKLVHRRKHVRTRR